MQSLYEMTNEKYQNKNGNSDHESIFERIVLKYLFQE